MSVIALGGSGIDPPWSPRASTRMARNRAKTLLFSALALAACSDPGPRTLGRTSDEGGSAGSRGFPHGGSQTGTGGTGGTIIPGGTGSGGTSPNCTGLMCRIEPCTGQTKTSITGRVFDPAGKVPLYNVVVYVPNTTLSAIPTGAACDTCSSPFSGQPIAVGLSGPDGRFVVNDAPSGDDIPLVVQVGKWRRQVILPRVESCTENRVDAADTRLPRDQSEGHIPKIAIATGGSDALECLLRKIGVSDSEFDSDTGTGRVHLYSGYGAPTTMADGTPLTDANELWADGARLNGYDIMLLSCEGNDNLFQDERVLQQFVNVRAFADRGGRIFGSHWHHAWINDINTPESPYPQVVAFSSGAHGFDPETPITVSVDTSFPKGEALADWLVNVAASTARASIELLGAEHSVDRVVTGGAAQRWIYGLDPERNDTDMLQYFSFNTPIGGTECGRMVFSDLHVSAGPDTDSGKEPFPEGCRTTDLSPQEKALEFMIFDLSSCVQPDTARPEPPPVVRSE
jgi:hypothetical protein